MPQLQQQSLGRGGANAKCARLLKSNQRVNAALPHHNTLLPVLMYRSLAHTTSSSNSDPQQQTCSTSAASTSQAADLLCSDPAVLAYVRTLDEHRKKCELSGRCDAAVCLLATTTDRWPSHRVLTHMHHHTCRKLTAHNNIGTQRLLQLLVASRTYRQRRARDSQGCSRCCISGSWGSCRKNFSRFVTVCTLYERSCLCWTPGPLAHTSCYHPTTLYASCYHPLSHAEHGHPRRSHARHTCMLPAGEPGV